LDVEAMRAETRRCGDRDRTGRKKILAGLTNLIYELEMGPQPDLSPVQTSLTALPNGANRAGAGAKPPPGLGQALEGFPAPRLGRSVHPVS